MTTILICDDEIGMVEAITDLLSDEGYRVVTASNGEQGLAMVTAERPSLVIVDLMMPVVGGVEMVRRLRELPGQQSLPVILMSAAPQPPVTRQKGNVFAITAFLRKPFQIQALLEEIERVLPDTAHEKSVASKSLADRGLH